MDWPDISFPPINLWSYPSYNQEKYMGINLKQLQDLIVEPTLAQFDLYSKAAEQLVLGTIAAESIIGTTQYIKQTKGPALGIIQMEPATHDWLKDYLIKRSSRFNKLITWIQHTGGFHSERLIYDLKYCVVMCRIRYMAVAAPLPAANDWRALGAYWKQHYNTPAGKGTVDGFLTKTQSLTRVA
jgi:hypothetical protein